MKALVLDDSAPTLFMLTKLVQGAGIGLVDARRDPADALDVARREAFDIVVVDYMMPGKNGVEVIAELRAMRGYEDVPIVMVTTVEEREICYKALEAGATDFLLKPLDMTEAKARLRNLCAFREMQNRLRDKAGWLADEVRKATYEMQMLERELVMRLSRAVEQRDGETAAHVDRVASLCEDVALELGLNRQFCDDIHLAAPMHDVGKIAVPDSILKKPGPLSSEERRQMQRHTLAGAEILSGSGLRLLKMATEIAESHHEKWDGTGYPAGISGEAIPISARITAVADVYDALISSRPYKQPWTPADAVAHIAAEAGKHFDPDVVAAFLRVVSRRAAEPSAPAIAVLKTA